MPLFGAELRGQQIASEPVECRRRIDHDFTSHILVTDPVAEGVAQIAIVGFGYVLIGVRPVATPHDPIGSGPDQSLCHRLDVVLGRKVRFAPATGA